MVNTILSSTLLSSLYLCCSRRDGSGTNRDVSQEVGLAICEAFEQADKVHLNVVAKEFPTEKKYPILFKKALLRQITRKVFGKVK